jgi:LacI family transcriptional regulator, galactose operon repressor
MDKFSSDIPKVLLTIESSREHGRKLLRGIARYAAVNGPWSFHFEMPAPFYRDDRWAGNDSASKMKEWNISGVITRNPKLTEKLTKSGIPTIIAIDSGENIFPLVPRILMDHEGIGELAAQEFYNCGYRNFAYCGIKEMHWSIRRANGFKGLLSGAGFKIHSYEDESRKEPWEKGQVKLSTWVKNIPKPIGVFACNDDRGRDIIEAARVSKIRIPEDMAVLGVDDDHLICNFCNPNLSSIALDAEKGGYDAAKILDDMMSGHKVEGQTIIIRPIGIQARRSTDAVAVDDEDVREALRFIHDCSEKEDIQVTDVVEMVAISRRRLQEKFSQTLGRTITDEIKRVRVEKIAQMLLSTKLPVSKIALKLGFRDNYHIARFFRQQMGCSPVEYRQKYNH